MSWKKLFAASDVSTRKVERVLMRTLTGDDNADADVRANRQTRLFTSVVLKRFVFQETMWESWQRESRTDRASCAMTKAGSLRFIWNVTSHADEAEIMGGDCSVSNTAA